MKKNIPPLTISEEIMGKLNNAIKASLEFEKVTGKQLNMTGIVGEVLACKRHNLELVVDDINEGFDAWDKDGKRVQIKTRRFKGVDSAMTGTLLSKQYEPTFDYAVLILLNEQYEFLEDHILSSHVIKEHFDRINAKRVNEGKAKRKNMSIAQFRALTKKQ